MTVSPADRPLAAYQEEALRLFFAPSATDEELATLGPPDRWRIYRNMVRNRIEKVIRAALPRTMRALGAESANRALVSYFADSAPTTRWFREIPNQFAAHLGSRLEELAPEAPAHLADLLRFERALWEVRHQEATPAGEVVELDFALPPAPTPALRRLRVGHRVDTIAAPGKAGAVASSDPEGEPATPAAEPANLAVYRRLDDRPSTWVLNDLAAALLDAFVTGEGSLAERVQAVTAARDVAIDEAFLEGLGTLLADFVERGVLLGSYRAG